MINIKITLEQVGVLAGLVSAGAKSPNTGSEAVVQGAEMLLLLQKAIEDSKKFVVENVTKINE